MENKTKENSSIFDSFTNKYALSKTLRFELRPVGKTLENMQAYLDYDEDLKTFLKDQRIEDAYQTLKSALDALHEAFITDSLETSENINDILFSNYVELKIKFFKEIADLKKRGEYTTDSPEVKRIENEIAEMEKTFRVEIGKAFLITGEKWKEKHRKYAWKKGQNIAKGSDILLSQDALTLIGDTNKEYNIQNALRTFKRFFTYLSGFNQNRENYYETSKEASTAIASRIIYVNLPKFSDNAFNFRTKQDEYLQTYDLLKRHGNSLTKKDGEKLHPIISSIFDASYFNTCLSQKQIEAYNEEIANANSVINLYNQANSDKKGFKRLPLFKILYKQIGCGKKKSLFFQLTHEKKIDADLAKEKEPNREVFSVEEILRIAARAGRRYFDGKDDDGFINTTPKLIKLIASQTDYAGFYWSKMALNTISNKYFADWRDLKDRLKKAKIFKRKRGDEEDTTIPEAIELQGLFDVLDATEDWRVTLFRDAVLDDEKKGKVIEESESAHKALLAMICDDISSYANAFLNATKIVEDISSAYFSLEDNDPKKEEVRKKWKEEIKAWMDHALAVIRMIKYFQVRETKIKGSPINDRLSQALDILLHAENADWFGWYDALRNFLTQKPQDDAKENKLKLNFENGSLLGGWSDGQEKNKAAVLLRKDDFHYLGILKKKNIFDTEKDDNEIYKNTSPNTGRMILMNLSFKTLTGLGFMGEFDKKYGDMGRENPQKAIHCLQKIIADRYVQKYPLLKKFIAAKYSDKKVFDKEIKEALKESYICEFRDIDWRKVEAYTEKADLYLFQIYSKDFASKSTGRKNIQTVYWNSVLAENILHQLNGGGEIFYRKQAIKDKKIKAGYENKPWVVEQKRFTEESGKFSFHCPITLNYKSKAYSDPKYAFPEINRSVNEQFKKYPNIYFLGIDRGEKHLAYYSLVDISGRIAHQGTLNVPFVDKNGKPRTVKAKKRSLDKDGREQETEVECRDYNDLLDARAGDRDYARKNWQTIGTIKELKGGYISQVVHKIAMLATEKPTFIVLEDLNVGFMRGRQKIEKSVYQKFELALAKKFNFLVDKSKDGKYDETGSVFKALQLTPPVNNYGDIEKRKQAGVVLYVRPDYTSQTDPTTGWRKIIYLKKAKDDVVKQQIADYFSDIGFDGKDYFFVCKKDENTDKEWTLYSGKNGEGLDRYHKERGIDKGEWKAVKKDIVEMLNGIFPEGIFDKTRSLYAQIVDEGIEPQKIDALHTAWESLRFTIHLIQQIRNTGKPDDRRNADFILSPVRDENGNHFDSRTYWDKEQRGEFAELPSSGDANGAYNIARKGIILNEHIRHDLKPYIRDEEWDAWLAGKAIWERWLRINSDRLKNKKLVIKT